MEQVVANIYASCLSAEAEPNGELVDLTISAIQDGLAGSNKDETLELIFNAVEELGAERKQKGALFRIKLTSIASSAKSLPPQTRSALLKSLSAMGEVAQQHSLTATLDTIKLMSEAISKVDSNTAVGHPASPPVPPVAQKAPPASEAPQPKAQLTLIEYLKQHATHAISDKIAFAPDIPLKKLSGALTSIGAYVKPDEVVVLVDDTVFGGSKEGVFITNDRIFVKEKFTDLAIYRLDSIHHLGADGLKIFINHREIVGLTQPDKPDMEMLFSAINDYLMLIRQKSNPPAPPVPPSMDYEEEEEEDGLDEIHGFFYLKAANLYADQDIQQFERMLMVDLLNISMGLYQFLLMNGMSPSERAKWFATSDLMHFESLLYVAELAVYLMETKIEAKQSDVEDFNAFVYGHLVFPYTDLFNDESFVTEQMRRRVGLYKALMRNQPTELPVALHACLTNPSFVPLFGGELREDMNFALYHLQAECLSKEVAFAYLRDVSSRVEESLVRYGINIIS